MVHFYRITCMRVLKAFSCGHLTSIGDPAGKAGTPRRVIGESRGEAPFGGLTPKTNHPPTPKVFFFFNFTLSIYISFTSLKLHTTIPFYLSKITLQTFYSHLISLPFYLSILIFRIKLFLIFKIM